MSSFYCQTFFNTLNCVLQIHIRAKQEMYNDCGHACQASSCAFKKPCFLICISKYNRCLQIRTKYYSRLLCFPEHISFCSQTSNWPYQLSECHAILQVTNNSWCFAHGIRSPSSYTYFQLTYSDISASDFSGTNSEASSV